MSEKLTEYLQGLYKRAARDLARETGEMFKSSEGRGNFNVSRLKEKLEEHLPSKYSFTQATEVFDREGTHAECKDFLIYDRERNLSLLSPQSSNTPPTAGGYGIRRL
jgi:hypothetical protein